jgi:hypothetical protein
LISLIEFPGGIASASTGSIPAGTIHAAKNVGSGNAAELATYVVEKGKPLATVVP